MSLKIWTSKEKLASTDLNASFDAVLNMSVYNEDLTAYTGSNAITFNTANKYEPGTLRVYASNAASGEIYRKKLKTGSGPADGDYLEVLDGNGQGTAFTFVSLVLPASAKLVVDYRKANL